ncbi:MAG: SusD/RagB family nutrient-binding outer membrane lipoprotein [Bacteroidales bacterium]|nr:SusD/RagB family nutrient-binding outer membrane lipoprotein [Bacteroidales bacterium]MCF8457998.1 SusD/RagB family nutrient-binding outer membrane lipoprotein [Bacteroidales bacterium]
MKLNIYISTLLLAFLLFVSCKKDFDDINHKQDTYVITSDGALLNGILNSLRIGKNENLYINNNILYPQTQLAALTHPANSSLTPGTEEIWSNYYSVLPNFRELEKRISQMTPTVNDTDSTTIVNVNANNMKAMLSILLAYKTFKVTDLFGDIPFSEAGYAYQEFNKLPKFDSQESIYKTLLAQLAWADSTLLAPTAVDTGRYVEFIKYDALFSGNLTNWRKFANSLRLRYAMRMADAEPELAGEIIAEIINNNLPVLVGVNFASPVLEQAKITPVSHGYENPGKYWSFSQQPNLRMSTSIWDQFIVNSEIIDPRLFYFFETNNAGVWAPYPSDTSSYPSEGGNPYSSNREVDSLFFDKGAGCAFSPVNFFLASDELNIPEILISGSEVHLIKAEAYYRGIGVPEDASKAVIELWNGVQASMVAWKNVMKVSELRYGNEFGSYIDVPTSLDVGNWESATNFAVSLELIYAQRWIDLFMQPCEAFAFARQTMQTPREGDDLNFFRLPIPPSEKNHNSANYTERYGSQGDNTNTKVWWMN